MRVYVCVCARMEKCFTEWVARGIREKREWNFLTTATGEINVALLRTATEGPVDSDMHRSAVPVVTTCFVKRRIERHKSLNDREGHGRRGWNDRASCFAEIAANGILEDFPAIHVEGGGRDDERMQRLLRSREIRKRKCGESSDINGRKLRFPLATNAR